MNKFKKGGLITSADDLVGELKKEKYIFYKDVVHYYKYVLSVPLDRIIETIENRNFFYAVEDDE